MPKYIFSSAGGLVKSYVPPKGHALALPVRIYFDGNATDSPFSDNVAAILSGFQLTSGVNQSLTDSLGGDLYLAVFNHAVYDISASITLFDVVCDETGKSGVSDFLTWWENRNVYATSNTIRIAFKNGKKPIESYMTNFNLTQAGPEADFWTGVVRLIGVPPRTTVKVGVEALPTAPGGVPPTPTVVPPAPGILPSPTPTPTNPLPYPLADNGDPLTRREYQITASGYMGIDTSIQGILGTIRDV